MFFSLKGDICICIRYFFSWLVKNRFLVLLCRPRVSLNLPHMIISKNFTLSGSFIVPRLRSAIMKYKLQVARVGIKTS
jgi:hypothetical protein